MAGIRTALVKKKGCNNTTCTPLQQQRIVCAYNQALAALVQGRACGLLATSSDLELGLLQSCFQLDEYEHLVKVKLCSCRRRGFGAPPSIFFLFLKTYGLRVNGGGRPGVYSFVISSRFWFIECKTAAAGQRPQQQGYRQSISRLPSCITTKEQAHLVSSNPHPDINNTTTYILFQ